MKNSVLILLILASSAWATDAGPGTGTDAGYRYFGGSQANLELMGCFKCAQPGPDNQCSQWTDRQVGYNPGYFGVCGDLTSRNFDGQTIQGDLLGANFSDASLANAVIVAGFSTSDDSASFDYEIAGAIFDGANLRHATFHPSEPGEGQNISLFANMSFKKADLRGADMTQIDAVVWTWNNLEGAFYDSTTKFPAGFDFARAKMIPDEHP